MEKNKSIIVSGVCKEFNGKKVLDNIDLEVESGEIIGLLGPSGAGKTTLIKILTGQLKPTRGKAFTLQRDTLELDSMTYTQIGMVLDNIGLYERLSCAENLSVYVKIYNLPKSRIVESLEKVGLKDARKLAVHKLSKGMKQRLALARAVMHEPKLLFLDEPTSGLDPKTARSIHELILEQRKRGTTIFLTTHNMEEAYRLCDKVALLCDGKIIEYGVPEEVCRRYNHKKAIRILLKNGEWIELENSSETTKSIAGYFEQDIVESIHSTEPDLETVFLELTGKRLV